MSYTKFHQKLRWKQLFNKKKNDFRVCIYEYYFFLDDYPELYGVLEEERILRKLKDVYGDEHFHKFKWMNEETKSN